MASKYEYTRIVQRGQGNTQVWTSTCFTSKTIRLYPHKILDLECKNSQQGHRLKFCNKLCMFLGWPSH
jgi:hypothetical protein